MGKRGRQKRKLDKIVDENVLDIIIKEMLILSEFLLVFFLMYISSFFGLFNLLISKNKIVIFNRRLKFIQDIYKIYMYILLLYIYVYIQVLYYINQF